MKGVVGPGGQGGFGRAGIWRQAGKAIAGAGWPGLTACVARRRRQPWEVDMGQQREGKGPDPTPTLTSLAAAAIGATAHGASCKRDPPSSWRVAPEWKIRS